MISRAVRQLLAVDALRRSQEGILARIIPPATAVLNLFACACFEPLLKDDPGGHYHAQFFLEQCAIYIALGISFFAGTTSIMLAKTRIFPLTPADRYAFTLASDLRRRIVIALAVSTSFFLAIVSRSEPATCALSSIAVYALLVVTTEALTATVVVAASHTSSPGATGIAIGGGLLLAVTVGLLWLGIDDLLSALPPVSWGAAALVAASGGRTTSFLLHAGLIAATGTIAILVGRKIA